MPLDDFGTMSLHVQQILIIVEKWHTKSSTLLNCDRILYFLLYQSFDRLILLLYVSLAIDDDRLLQNIGLHFLYQRGGFRFELIELL